MLEPLGEGKSRPRGKGFREGVTKKKREGLKL